LGNKLHGHPKYYVLLVSLLSFADKVKRKGKKCPSVSDISEMTQDML
jgi:hypothetical protein